VKERPHTFHVPELFVVYELLIMIAGRIMDELGYHYLMSGVINEADNLLNGALECMDEVGSVTGRASVHHHIGLLKYVLSVSASAFAH
jgi:hypothetical protein